MIPKYDEYVLPEISVIPPIETHGCHINLYYNGNVLVDTFYLFKDRQPTSLLKNWTIQGYGEKFRNSENTNLRYNMFYNMDHYHISLTVPYADKSDLKSEGKNKQYKNWERIQSLSFTFLLKKSV